MTSSPHPQAAADAVAAEALVGWPILRQLHLGDLLPTEDEELPCDLHGSQGRAVPVRLMQLRQDEALAMIRIAPAWRRLEMPLSRLSCLSFDSEHPPMRTAPRTLAMTLTAGSIVRHETVAAAEHPLGLFLVCRTPDDLAWRRLFYPSSSYRSLVWGPPPRPADAPCRTPDELRLALRVATAQGPEQANTPRVDVLRYPVHVPTLQRLPLTRATQLEVLPLDLLDGALVVAMDDPSHSDALPELAFLYGTRIEPVRPARHGTLHLLNTLYERHGLAPASWRG